MRKIHFHGSMRQRWDSKQQKGMSGKRICGRSEKILVNGCRLPDRVGGQTNLSGAQQQKKPQGFFPLRKQRKMDINNRRFRSVLQ